MKLELVDPDEEVWVPGAQLVLPELPELLEAGEALRPGLLLGDVAEALPVLVHDLDVAEHLESRALDGLQTSMTPRDGSLRLLEGSLDARYGVEVGVVRVDLGEPQPPHRRCDEGVVPVNLEGDLIQNVAGLRHIVQSVRDDP